MANAKKDNLESILSQLEIIFHSMESYFSKTILLHIEMEFFFFLRSLKLNPKIYKDWRIFLIEKMIFEDSF